MKFKTTLLLAFLAFSLTQCKKENTNDDLTTEVVGKYTSGSGSNYREIIVTKVNNSTVSIYLQDGFSSYQTHAETQMNSKTSFTLNKVTETNSGERFEYTGTGSASANNIVITRNEKVFNASTNSLISDDNYTYTGSK
jgi:hypothetical protein